MSKMPKTKKKHKRKTNGKTKKYRGGGGDGIYGTLIRYLDIIKRDKDNTCSTDSSGTDLNTCTIPNSKSDQIIRVCENSVFKGPKPGYKHNIKVYDNFIRVDPHTMNLLVQYAIKEQLPTAPIEHFNNICPMEGYSYALEGKAYKLDMSQNSTGSNSVAHSVEDYIKMINNNVMTIDSNEPDMTTQYAKQIIDWIESICKSLDILFEQLQFHHCDPKAAQLFLDGNEVIVGDLDKVTFTLKIDDKYYRMCLGSTLNRTAAYVQGSIPEKMRYETYPRQTNTFEKASFVASILLLLDNNIRRLVIENIRSNDKLSYLIDFILEDKLSVYANRPFSKKTGHRIASECVNMQRKPLKSEFVISTSNTANIN